MKKIYINATQAENIIIYKTLRDARYILRLNYDTEHFECVRVHNTYHRCKFYGYSIVKK